jgi:predicted metal-binding protein
MKIENRTTKRHLFICCNERTGKESCGPKNAQLLVSSIKKRLRDNELWNDYKITKSGCLGPCAFGITALLFPENQLITSLELSDENELYELLTKD